MDDLEENDVDFRTVAETRPFTFARMLSWEFSRPSVVVVRRKSTRSSSSRKSSDFDVTGEENDTTSLGSMSDEDVEGSDSSDYVTAEESPASEEEDLHQKRDRKHEKVDVDVATPDKLKLVLPAGGRRRQGRSKKQKRKRNRVKRGACVEFFAPFMEGFDEDAVEEAVAAAAEHETPVGRIVPSLSEFCVQRLWGGLSFGKQPPQSESALKKPLFMDQMKLERRRHQLIASVQLKWLHKHLADLESHEPKDSTNELKHYDWSLQASFTALDNYSGLFTPLPHPDPASNMYDAVAALAHVADLMVPVVVKSRDCSTTESRDSLYRPTAAWRLRSALHARYPKLTAKLLDDVLPYLWWARGELHQAAEMLVARSHFLKEFDKNLCGLYLNEAGRLYCQSGDRETASKFFRLASEAVPDYSYPTYGHTAPSRSDMVAMSALALSASTWDQGIVDNASGMQAARAWKAVMLDNDIPPPVKIEALFSRLSVHAGIVVGSTDPNVVKPVLVGNAAWLDECVALAASLAEKTPQLHHHLSLLYCLQGNNSYARRSHHEYIEKFAGFTTWQHGLPGSHHGMSMNEFPRLDRRANPWNGLVKLVESLTGPPPVLKLVWRYRLSHPPMCTGPEIDRLAYHVSKSLGIRLSCHGNITVDAIAHHPPIRGLQLDTHTGTVCFPQLPGTTTPWLSLPSEASLTAGGTMMPVPINLLDFDGAVQVELLQANSESRGRKYYTISENNLSLLYMTDYMTKRRVKVDIRSLVRRKLKEALLERASKEPGKPFEERRNVIEQFFARGWHCTWKDSLCHARMPSATEWSQMNGFHMQLKSAVRYGSATVALFFTVLSSRVEQSPDTIVIVDCRSMQSFKQPTVYGLDDDSSFELPLCSGHGRTNHFPSSKLLLCVKTRPALLLIFNECGQQIADVDFTGQEGHSMFTTIVGESLYGVTPSKNTVGCSRIENSEVSVVLESDPLPTVLSVKEAGNSVLVLTTRGLCVLDPDSLKSFPADTMKQSKLGKTDMTGVGDTRTQFAVLGEFNELTVFETTQLDASSQRTALALDYTFILLTVHRSSADCHVTVNFQLQLPGVPSEVLLLPGIRGVLVTTGLFMPDDPDFTEQLLWLSIDGELKGILPVLGLGPHAFFPLTLHPRPNKVQQAGLHVYFFDGHGGICCMAL